METVFLSLTKSDFQDLIAETVNACLKRNLSGKHFETPTQDGWMDINELRAYHPERPAKQTVYQWLSAGTIPAHKRGKKVYFSKKEIDQWLSASKRTTATTAANEANNFLANA